MGHHAAAVGRKTGAGSELRDVGPGRRFVRAAVVVVALVLLAGAVGLRAVTDDPTPQVAATGGTECAPWTLTTRRVGELGLAAPDGVGPPWMVPNPDRAPDGFQGAVADAVATQLQFPANQVAWNTWRLDPASDRFPPWFDIYVTEPAQVGDGPEVELSDPYYEVRPALMARKGSAAAKVRTLAAARRLRLGAVEGSNGFASAVALGGAAGPVGFPSAAAATTALAGGRVDAVVLGLPTALAIAEEDRLTVAGQLPGTVGTVEQLRFVLPKGSPLTVCVNRALATLRQRGTLAKLEARWLTTPAHPLLR
jgi:polar amino acid transport system substrate-binding protein